MIFDSVGLGYSAENGRVKVHYPRRVDGVAIPGAGATLDVEFPAFYFTDPPNEITRERAEIVRRLLV